MSMKFNMFTFKHLLQSELYLDITELDLIMTIYLNPNSDFDNLGNFRYLGFS